MEVTGLKQELAQRSEQARKAEDQAAALQKASRRLVEKAKKKLSAYRSPSRLLVKPLLQRNVHSSRWNI